MGRSGTQLRPRRLTACHSIDRRLTSGLLNTHAQDQAVISTHYAKGVAVAGDNRSGRRRFRCKERLTGLNTSEEESATTFISVAVVPATVTEHISRRASRGRSGTQEHLATNRLNGGPRNDTACCQRHIRKTVVAVRTHLPLTGTCGSLAGMPVMPSTLAQVAPESPIASGKEDNTSARH